MKMKFNYIGRKEIRPVHTVLVCMSDMLSCTRLKRDRQPGADVCI